MVMNIPVQFDDFVKITYFDGRTEVSDIFPASRGLEVCSFSKISGYDSNNNRITNLVGFDGHELLKVCPKCSGIKHVTDYGYSGRYTNRRRDQSQCSYCRSLY